MSRISPSILARAITAVQAMDFRGKERLADEVFRAQPHLFGSFLVQQRLGVSLDKMEFLLELLLVCFQAMKESGLTWPVITEADLERQSQRYVASVKFGDGLADDLRDRAMRQYIEVHPEPTLLAYVQAESANWLKRINPDETDKYVLLAAANFVNGIAYART